MKLNTQSADSSALDRRFNVGLVPGAVRPLLSVVSPVFNGAAFIGENAEAIYTALSEAGVPYEVIVVSDGSVDATAEQMLLRRHERLRFLHYERNMGKGYAVKVGMLAARGEFVGFIDSDLDLRPQELVGYLKRLQKGDLDAVIGSKRHPDSHVDYPARRRAGSIVYQALLKLLFGLNVRDTQVGVKLFRRELVEAVVPHLLVKRYAFDLELLVVARAFGYGRVEEAPIWLDYRFTGSGMHLRAISQALTDTLAVFYRLRILRYYQRRKQMLGRAGGSTVESSIAVVVLADPHVGEDDIDRTVLSLHQLERVPDEIVVSRRGIGELDASVLDSTTSELVGLVEAGAIPASNWLSATTPFFCDAEMAAVGGPLVPAHHGALRADVTGALYESRFAAGPAARRHLPGNLRETPDLSPRNMIVRRSVARRFVDRLEADPTLHMGAFGEVNARVGRQLYVPDAPVVASMPPLGRAFFGSLFNHGQSRGRRFRKGAGGPAFVVVPAIFVVGLALLAAGLALGEQIRIVAFGVLVMYAVGAIYACVHAGIRRGRVAIGVVLFPLIPAVHVIYGVGMLWGLVAGRGGRP